MLHVADFVEFCGAIISGIIPKYSHELPLPGLIAVNAGCLSRRRSSCCSWMITLPLVDPIVCEVEVRVGVVGA